MAIGATFTDLTPEGQVFFQELYELQDQKVYAGIKEGTVYEDGTSVAAVAAFNEYGTSTIPPRPFMKQSFEKNRSELETMCTEALRTVNEGGSADAGLEKIGLFMKESIRKEIDTGSFTPNAESTVKAKGSSKPLIDTGLMRDSVDYEVTNR